MTKIKDRKQEEKEIREFEKNYVFKTDYDTLGKVIASPNKQKILYILNIPKTPKQIAKATNLNFPTTSKTIKELETLNLIEIKNKQLRKGKIIVLSNKGKCVMTDLKQAPD